MSEGCAPDSFLLSACAGGGQTTMNRTKQIGLTALVFVTVLGLKGEEKMPRGHHRATKHAAQPVQKVEGTGNLSKKHRAELIGKIDEIRAFLERSGDTNAARLITFAAELEKEIRQKKYGLVFEEHKERVDVELEKNLPVLTENKKRFIDKGGELNFLIEGDNLAALKLLEKTHKEKIDLIYIDPPYNTGNKDFMYNDSYVDATDTFRHSKWLSFMKKRLELARLLLKTTGVIFISIDDKEYANLKALADSVFAEENYIATMVWKSKSGGAGDASLIATDHEYILSYARRIAQARINNDMGAVVTTVYNRKDENGRYSLDRLDKQSLGYQPSLDFPIVGPDGRTYVVEHKDPNVKKARWRWGKDTVKERYDELVFQYPYVYTKNYEKHDGQKPRSILFDERFGRTRTGSTDLKKALGNQTIFTYPKPVVLMGYLTEIGAVKDGLVLDFFAGSGTLGHAVMKLNAEDGGKRKFILVTNNENGICEKVTYERLKRVIAKEGYKARLKYFKVDYVPIERRVYFEYADELLKHIRELVELENAIDFSADATIAIAVTDGEFAQFVASEKEMSGKKAIYVGHDVLIGAKARKLLQSKGIEIRIIPEYYYAEQEG